MEWRVAARTFGPAVRDGSAVAATRASRAATVAVATGEGEGVAVGSTGVAEGAADGAAVGGSGMVGAGAGPSANRAATRAGVADGRASGGAARARSAAPNGGVGETIPAAGGVAHAPNRKTESAMTTAARWDSTGIHSAFPRDQADSIDDTPSAW